MVKKVISAFVCSFILSSCISTRHTEQSVLEHQRQIDRVEESIRTRDRAIDTCIRELAYISSRSETMAGDIDDIIRELDLYYAAVQRLLRAAGYSADEEQDAEKGAGIID